MANLALVVSDLGPNSARVIDALRREFDLGVPAILTAVGTGRPVAERKLFDRHAPEQTERLPALLERLGEFGCQFTAYQVPDTAAFGPNGTYLELTPDRLRARRAERAESIAEQQRYAELEGDAE